MGLDADAIRRPGSAPAWTVVRRTGAVVKMMTRTGIVVLLATLDAVALPGWRPAAAQDLNASQEKAARVTFPQSVGPPGGVVSIPVQLTGGESVNIGGLTVTLRFPAARLTFTKAEVGGLGTAVGARVTARTERRGDETVLEVTIATPEVSGAKTALPDGPIAQLMFTVAKDLKPETVIALKAEAAALGLTAAAKPVTIPTGDGEIVVSNPSVISCFFYMH